MSKGAKIKMADILHNAGFSPRPILELIKYPKVKNIRVTLPAGSVASLPASVTVVSGEERNKISLEDNKSSKVSPQVFPIVSHLEFTPESYVFEFFHTNNNPRKIIASDYFSIPQAPGWPELKTFNPKYPVPLAQQS